MMDDEKQAVGVPSPASAVAAAAGSSAASLVAAAHAAAPAPLGAPRARMVIQKMVLHNFKSYAGTKEIGPFHKNFSSVVGPNGSGKSNVIDSLLFVLGRRANQIRLKKLSELIHKSAAHPNLTECRVDVHFAEIIDIDDVDAFRLVAGSEFVVSRLANHESKSTYKINNRTCSGDDVQTLLKSKGMDLDNNRFLILQGEVEQIAMMKPKAAGPHDIGILEYLEDLIGTNQYVAPIEALAAKVDQCNEQRADVLQRVKMAEKEKEALEGPKLEAEAYAAKTLQLNIVKVQQAQLQRHQLQSQNAECKARRAELDEKKAANDAAMSEKTSESKALESEFTTQQQSRDAIATTMATCKSDFAAFERKDVKYRESQKHKRNLLKKAQAKRTKAATALQELEDKIAADETNQPRVVKKLDKLRADLVGEEAKLSSMHTALVAAAEPFKLEIEAQQKALMPLQQECNKAQQTLDVCVSEINIYRDKIASAESKFDAVRAQVQKNAPEMERLAEEVKRLRKKLADEQTKLKRVEEEQAQLAKAEMTGLQRRTQLLGLLEESKAAAASGASQNKVLSSLLAAKKKGVLPGLFGRLGDLGAIDAKYDVAITTGVGALNHVLVDSTATGNRAITFLKTNNLGRGAFLALDKCAFPAERLAKASETPEGVPRLFDLVTPTEARFLPAIYFACRETLVADTLEQATRIAFGKGINVSAAQAGKRWRVVTLDGKVIEPAGTMSGGGDSVRRGGMMLKGSAATARKQAETDDGSAEGKVDIKAAESELSKLEANLAALRQRKRELEAELKAATQAVRDTESAASRAESEGKELATTTAELRARAAQLEKSLRMSPEDLAALKALEASQSTHQSALTTAKKATKALTDKIAILQAKIMERGGAQLDEQQKRVERMNAEIAALQEELNRMAVLAETGASKRAKLESEVSECDGETSELERALEALQADFTKLEEDALKVHEAFKAAEASLGQADAALDAIQARFESVKAALHKLRSLDIELEEQRLAFQKEMREHMARYAQWDRKIAQLVRSINRELLAQKTEMDVDNMPAQPAAAEAADEEKKEDDEEAAPAAASKKRGGRAGRARGAAADDAMDVDFEDAAAAAAAESTFEGSYQLLSVEELESLDRRALEREQVLLEETLAPMRPNMAAIVAYLKKEKEYNARVAVLDQVTLERDAARKGLDEIRKRRLDEFMRGFSLISTRLKEMYQMLTLGGDAELELVDSLDPFSEGIVFSVRPPKKSWKNISNLSGGEKTLSSLALVFALHHFKPTPLYVMDEIDAALDFKNVSIVANYIKERTKDAQFIIISLRNNMFELADRLVGIYKTNNQTNSITIDPRLFANQQQQQQADAGKKEEEKSPHIVHA